VRERFSEDGGDFDAAEVASSQYEDTRFARPQRSDFQGTISEPLILGEYHPTACSHLLEPDAVFFVTREMVVMDLDDETGVDKFRSDWFYAQRPVDEEYCSIRRLRNGLLLRWHWSPD
jgi:hypothetical protein